MEQTLLMLSPFLVSLITAGFKKLPPFVSVNGEGKKGVIRVGVAVLSFASIVASTWITGGELNVASAETFVNTIMVFLGSTGVYFFVRK